MKLPLLRVLAATTIYVLTLAASAPSGTVVADEGMWLFNHPPNKLLKERHGFTADEAWLTHLQRSAVRFNSGGSGSFVSNKGLVMTNHHVGADALQKLSGETQNLVKTGFYAKAPAEEIKCVDLELNVLMNMEDVTARVNAAVKADLSAADAQKARRAIMNTIEKESLDKTGLRSDVVTLYQGGAYHLYRFKKYTDVRLVFAPEQDIAFFGGDPDNFEYPRYDLDVCFFRVYENDKPAEPEHYLRWSSGGAGDGELVFVAGHPGRTDRLNTAAHLEFMRDKQYPLSLNTLRRREVLLKTYGERSLENARRAQDDLFSYQNSRKARLGGLAGLQDPSFIAKKKAGEEKLRKAAGGNPKLVPAVKALDDVAKAIKLNSTLYADFYLLEGPGGFNSQLFHIARELVRMADESAKPNAERLREYRESNRESLEQELFSTAPIYADFESLKLGDSLGMIVELAGAGDPLVVKILDGRSPRDRAAQLVAGTKLADVAVRKKLAEGGKEAIAKSDDPLIGLARLVDERARKVRKTYEEEVEEPLRQAYAKIAQARLSADGEEVYPDATFTLRLAFGLVKGYEEAGAKVPPWTTLGGAYKHAEAHESRPPFQLPASWLAKRDKLKLDTPCNFICTADIIGGNSGSPVVNRQGEVVGLIFDGNIQSLVWDFFFDDVQGRALSVHSAAITEALRVVYDAGALADELQGSKTASRR